MYSYSYVGICFEHLPDSPTLASLQEHYICFTDNLHDACNKVYSFILKQSMKNQSQYTNKYHIEKYDVPLEELEAHGMMTNPINFFTFNSQFECICNRTNEIVWQL
jgi:hypothetical protein